MIAPAQPERVDLSTRLLTRAEVGQLLAINASTVAALARRHDDPLPSHKIGGSRRYHLVEVERWVARQPGR